MQDISWEAQKTYGACWAVNDADVENMKSSHAGHYCMLRMHTTLRSSERALLNSVLCVFSPRPEKL